MAERSVRVVLASSSPRRHELLRRVGVEFDVVSPDVDETHLPGEAPVEYVRRVAVDKAMVVGARDSGGSASVGDALVIAADTTVDVDGVVLAKPDGLDDARRMLWLLSGRSHQVHTGVAVLRGGRVVSEVVSTEVTFVALDEPTIEWYLAHDHVLDKAGAYAMQEAGAALVERIAGSVSNVIGLPLATLIRLAGELGVPLLAPPPAPS